MSDEFDWDDPDEGVVDFEDLEQTEMGAPIKKETIIKPKTGFNKNSLDIESFKNRSQQMSSREEDRKLLTELMFVSEQLKGNITELQKLDGIAQRAKALNELDTQVIAQKLKDMSLEHISRLITDRLNKQFESSRAEIAKGANAAEAAAKDLSVKAENLRVVADDFRNLDNMASDLDEFVRKFKSMGVKNLYLGVIVATVVGIFTGGILSYASQTVGNPTAATATTAEAINSGEILTAKFGAIGAVQDNRDPKWYYIVIPDGARVKEVVSFVEDGKRYIRIEAKK